MTDSMFGYQLNFKGRKQHKKARWKRARKRWWRNYVNINRRFGTWDSLCDEPPD